MNNQNPPKLASDRLDEMLSEASRATYSHPMFRDHRCWKCNDGKKGCPAGNPNQCEFPRARND